MKIYRAKLVLPVASPRIEDGPVAVEGGRIAGVGAAKEICRTFSGAVHDLGEVILLPGLINAHCHLDYTVMRGAILNSGSFAGWIERLNAIKRSLTQDDFIESIRLGFRELTEWGTTSVFNIESFPELLPRLEPPPIRTWWFYELLDVRNRIDTEEVVMGALSFFDERPGWLGGFGLSPHAPYTTSLHLYDLVRQCAEKYGMPVMTHLSETEEEVLMFKEASGSLYDFLRHLGRNMSDTGGKTPLAYLMHANVLPKGALLSHMNFLSASDFDLLALRGSSFHVVHCPRTHAYFERPRFEYERLRATGISISIGTDSLASNQSLNLFEEMRMFASQFPAVPPQEILEMVTTNPAGTIGRRRELGVLREGACADLIAVPFTGPLSLAYEVLVHNKIPPVFVAVDGKAARLSHKRIAHRSRRRNPDRSG